MPMTIGMRSTQTHWKLHEDLKTFLKPDLDIIQFFKHFDRVVIYNSKALKTRRCLKICRKRPKIFIEKQSKKKKGVQVYSTSQNMENMASNSMCGVSTSQPVQFVSNIIDHGGKVCFFFFFMCFIMQNIFCFLKLDCCLLFWHQTTFFTNFHGYTLRFILL